MFTYPEYYKQSASRLGASDEMIRKFYQTGVFDMPQMSEKFYEAVASLGNQVSERIKRQKAE